MLGGKSGGNCEGQEFVLCIGRGLVRARWYGKLLYDAGGECRVVRRESGTGQGENRGETLRGQAVVVAVVEDGDGGRCWWKDF